METSENQNQTQVETLVEIQDKLQALAKAIEGTNEYQTLANQQAHGSLLQASLIYVEQALGTISIYIEKSQKPQKYNKLASAVVKEKVTEYPEDASDALMQIMDVEAALDVELSSVQLKLLMSTVAASGDTLEEYRLRMIQIFTDHLDKMPSNLIA